MVAAVTLVRGEDSASAIMNKKYVEEVRGYVDIMWAPQHVVFNMKDGTTIAYHADRVYEIVTSEE